MYAMHHALEMIGDVPVFWSGIAFDIDAALGILAVNLSSAATHAGPYRRAGDSATGSGNIPAASTTDLVPENAADDCANDRPGDIGSVVSVFNDLLTLDPAALLRRADHRTHRSDGDLV